MDWSKVTFAMLRESRPDLVAEVEKSAMADAQQKVKEAEAAAANAVAEAAKSKDAATAALTEQFRAEMKAGFAEQAKVIDALRAENHGLKQRLDEKEVRERLLAKDQLIGSLLAESGLPAEAITPLFREDLKRLSERKDGDKVVTIEEQIKERIAERKKLVAPGEAKITGAGASASVVGASNPQNAIEEQVVIDEAFRRKYSNLYGMDLTPETVLAEYRKRQAEPKK